MDNSHHGDAEAVLERTGPTSDLQGSRRPGARRNAVRLIVDDTAAELDRIFAEKADGDLNLFDTTLAARHVVSRARLALEAELIAELTELRSSLDAVASILEEGVVPALDGR